MFQKIKDLLVLNKAIGQYEEIRKEIDTMNGKNFLLSKTFWANVLGLGLTIGGILPQKWSVPVITIANIGLRLITNQPVNIFPQ